MSAVAAGVEEARRGDPVTADATIAAVVFGDRPLLELNRRFTARLNPGHAARWRIVRNLPLQPADTADEDDGAEILDGRELPEEYHELKKFRSYHHALALNVACREVATRYLILVDPDCYIVRPNWLADVLEHMRERNLGFFGVPYHPRSLAKLRYFPCSVFLVVDTEQVPVQTLDWLPQAERPRRAGPFRRTAASTDPATGWRLRLRYEESEDTGVRVYTRYRKSGVAAECAQAVVIPEHLRTYLKNSPLQRVLEKILPDRFCTIPKRRGYITDRRFADFGYVDTAARAIWAEEFLWRGEPFALHLRKVPETLRGDPDAVARLLAQFG